MTRLGSALVLVVLAIAGAVYTVVAGNTPLLGLDLQGGVAVVYETTSEADEEQLDQAIETIRSRVDGLGIAEPEITRQNQNIIVSLPGADEQQRALELVGETAELRFRPVIIPLGAGGITLDPEAETTTDDPDADADDPDATTEDTEVDPDADDPDVDEDADTEESLRSGGRFGAAAPAQDDGDDTTTTTEAVTDETTDESEVTEDGEVTEEGDTIDEEQADALSPAQAAALEACLSTETVTPRDEDDPEGYSVLADPDGNRYCVGPALARGDVLEDAIASLNPFGTEWIVSPTFKPGADGIDQFNLAAARCASFDPDVCPSGQLAIVLDQEVVSAPNVQSSSFQRDQVQISGTFDQESAEDLALKLRFGALPVELEAQQTQTVSATIGDDVLRSGVIAGIVGLAVVAVYLLWFYRLAGLVAILGVGLSALFAWTIIAWLGSTQGLALTLAGVVGLIVSIGVSADSNIVYFENVKDAAKSGTRVGTAVDRAFQSAFSTIVKADVVSLIAAGLLWWLTVGAVRGFAFYLGLATILDLIVSWLFMRPALAFFADLGAVRKNPRLLGLPEGVKT